MNAKGWNSNDANIFPFNSIKKERVIPHAGQGNPAIVQFILMFFYVGYILFAINVNNNLNAIRAKKGYPEKDQMVLYLILSIVFPISLVALVQNDINELA